jgi:hypothetical protein
MRIYSIDGGAPTMTRIRTAILTGSWSEGSATSIDIAAKNLAKPKWCASKERSEYTLPFTIDGLHPFFAVLVRRIHGSRVGDGLNLKGFQCHAAG